MACPVPEDRLTSRWREPGGKRCAPIAPAGEAAATVRRSPGGHASRPGRASAAAAITWPTAAAAACGHQCCPAGARWTGSRGTGVV